MTLSRSGRYALFLLLATGINLTDAWAVASQVSPERRVRKGAAPGNKLRLW